MINFESGSSVLTVMLTDAGLILNLSHNGSGFAITLNAVEAGQLQKAIAKMIPDIPEPPISA